LEKLDIKFYGADGKRKYSYNKSIKHIKDCITCIRANQSIINNKFYDDMIKINKYYLPLRNGIYSFKENKLYSDKELAHINFSYKIDRNFPKLNKDYYDDLMNKVIIPIYPNQDERNYNAHIDLHSTMSIAKLDGNVIIVFSYCFLCVSLSLLDMGTLVFLLYRHIHL
jgi:hypothetical protein